jgi:hypothetical protein
MQRKPQSPLESWFVANGKAVLEALMGTPDLDDGRDIVFATDSGRVAWTYASDDPADLGVFVRRRDNAGGAGLDVLPLLDLTEADVERARAELGEHPVASDHEIPARPFGVDDDDTEPVRPPSAGRCERLLAGMVEDDGRIAAYLASRGIKIDLEGLGLGLSGTRTKLRDLIVVATDEAGEAVAVQTLTLDCDGRPTLDPDGRKVRRTFALERKWNRKAGFRIPGEGDEVVLVEGPEDALSVRAAGWAGPIVAMLGKGNAAAFTPAYGHVVLAFDGDVTRAERDKRVTRLARAGKSIRVASFAVGEDAAAMVEHGEAQALLAMLEAAEPARSAVAELERELGEDVFPFSVDGDTAYAAERRKIAKRLGIAVADLDKIRQRMRAEHDAAASEENAEFEDYGANRVEPWSTPIADPAAMFDAAFAALQTRVQVPHPPSLAMVLLWAAHTRCFKRWKVTPRLYCFSPVPEAGKTELLNSIVWLCDGAVKLELATGAGLYREIDRAGEGRVLCVDEVEDSPTGGLYGDERIRAVFNGNGTRVAGGVLLTEEVEDGRTRKIQPRRLSTLAPMAFAGLASLKPTMRSRAIVIHMQTYDVGYTPDVDSLTEHASKIARWIDDNADSFDECPDLPALSRKPGPRLADLWRPMIAIAEAIGGQWPDLVRQAMEDVFAFAPPMNAAQRLLLDVRRVFDARREAGGVKPEHRDLITSRELVDALDEQEHGDEHFRGVSSHHTAREQRLASRLSEWRIGPSRARQPGYPGADKQGRVRVYRREDFEDVWTRHKIDDAVFAISDDADGQDDGTGNSRTQSEESAPKWRETMGRAKAAKMPSRRFPSKHPENTSPRARVASTRPRASKPASLNLDGEVLVSDRPGTKVPAKTNGPAGANGSAHYYVNLLRAKAAHIAQRVRLRELRVARIDADPEDLATLTAAVDAGVPVADMLRAAVPEADRGTLQAMLTIYRLDERGATDA